MTQKKKRFNISILRVSGTTNCAYEQRQKFIDVLIEQIVDSAIVGGISGVSAYIAAGENASFKTFFIAFALMFLVKLKEYRKL
jgi:hypothetical protein